MIFRRPLLSILVLLMIFIIIDIYIETNYPTLSTVHLESGKLPNGTELKILQISDLHDKRFGDGENALIRLVSRAEADVVVLTGDIADVKTRDFANILKFTGQLVKKVPLVCFIPGNHEQGNYKSDQFYKSLSGQGIKLLFDKSCVYKTKNMSVNICGIDYPFKETKSFSGPIAEKEALSKALRGIDASWYTILLSHSPKIADNIGKMPIDLILSGHTHGGQVRLPFIGSLLVLDPDFYSKYDKGLFKLGSGAMLYVDSGLGTSILPIRFCDRADITLITVVGKS
jgi:predicted MPP superfamily phosphohydrolase